MAAPAAREPFFRVFAGILLVMVTVAGADLALVRADRADRNATGARLYREGEELMRQQRYAEASEHFRDALTQLPGTPAYQLALVRAFEHLGKLDEAEGALTEFLQRYPTAGDANLLMARIQRRRGRAADATWYYHRALYGNWPDDSGSRRVGVRFELADLLAERGASQELLAELLPLQNESPADAGTKARLARLFLAAHSWARAADLYRQLIREHPEDASAYAGLGDAQFGAEQYSQAAHAYQTAARFDTSRSDLPRKANSAREILSLDPTLRGLSATERERRSRALLQRVLDAVACPSAADTPEQAQARQALNPPKKKPDPDTDTVEDNIALAEQLWRSRSAASCSSGTAESNQVLTLLLAKLAQ